MSMSMILKKIKQDKIFIFLLFLLGIILFIAIFANFLAPYNPYVGDLKNAFIAPNSEHLLGTDRLGRDILSRIFYAIRISFFVALALAFFIAFVGSLIGIIAGYFKGFIDTIIMRISDILMSCPSMVLAIALAGIMGASIKNAMLAIFVVTVSKYIRLSRSLLLKIINEEYIQSARLAGTKDIHIITRHILPNIFQTLLVTASTDFGVIILELSALSFLGFGVPAPMPELGLMINEGRAYMMNAPWLIIYPGITIFIIVTVFNQISDRLRKILD